MPGSPFSAMDTSPWQPANPTVTHRFRRRWTGFPGNLSALRTPGYFTTNEQHLMKRLYLILLLAIALVPSYAQYRSGYQDLYDSETVSRLKEHVSYLASSMTEGRKAGSEGEAIAARYVSETLESYGA